MAETAKGTHRIAVDSRVVKSAVMTLPEVEVGWEQEPILNRMAWEMEWRDAMGRVGRLAATQ